MQHQIDQMLSKAIQCFQNGNIDETEQVLLRVLDSQPRNFDALHIMGVVKGVKNQHKDALEYFRKALRIDANNSSLNFNIAKAFSEVGDEEKALKYHLIATKLNPSHPEGWLNLSKSLSNLGKFSDSLASVDKAIALNPKYAEAWTNRGSLLTELERYTEALSSFDESLRINPQLAETWSNRGVALIELGQLEQAMASFDEAIHIKPDYAEAWCNRGIALLNMGNHEQALASCDQTIQIQPDNAEAWSNRGIALLYMGRQEQALASYDKAISIKPNYAEAWFNQGNALLDLGQYEPALTSYDNAIRIKSTYAEAWSNRGIALLNLGRHEQALSSYDHATRIKPDYAEAWSNHGSALCSICRFDQAEISFREAIHHDPDNLAIRSSWLFNLNYMGSIDSVCMRSEANVYGSKAAEKVPSKFTEWILPVNADKLRIGFVSGDLYRHPVGYFIEGLVEHLDRSKFELYAFTTNNTVDELTRRIKPFFTQWTSIHNISDSAAAHLIHKNGVQILIDLSGHTKNNRLPLFSYKPAPVQASWLGYFSTTGVSEMDYFLGDPYIAPSSEDSHFIEKIWRLPETWFCLKPPVVQLMPSDLPALHCEHLTFGSLGNLSKMNERVVGAFARVLQRVPNSKLLLKAKQFNNQAQIEEVQKRFAKFDVSADRLLIEEPETRTEYFQTYNKIDFVLDTFPYPGGTTSLDALWMGVPVLTLKGDRFLSRLGESIAINAGLSDWIAKDIDEFVDKAAAFSSDVTRLAELRHTLRGRVQSTPLFDTSRFATHFADALWGMWHQRSVPE